ncbi:hypothetical protein EUGRSUZ_K02394 [Eucalyptus grandis]|uniref:Uncharacterized protein n=2 Tax=Eucalyptus grandis TaxID=71139 RepID=A0ACC3IXT2_EUCGR|nr:hypothetical protein EUGRSUZ_K02394 [Eucalyptus grandis]
MHSTKRGLHRFGSSISSSTWGARSEENDAGHFLGLEPGPRPERTHGNAQHETNRLSCTQKTQESETTRSAILSPKQGSAKRVRGG